MALHILRPAFVESDQDIRPHAWALLFYLIIQQQLHHETLTLFTYWLLSNWESQVLFSFFWSASFWKLLSPTPWSLLLTIPSVTMTFKMMLSWNIEFSRILSIFYCVSNSLYLINKPALSRDYLRKRKLRETQTKIPALSLIDPIIELFGASIWHL